MREPLRERQLRESRDGFAGAVHRRVFRTTRPVRFILRHPQAGQCGVDRWIAGVGRDGSHQIPLGLGRPATLEARETHPLERPSVVRRDSQRRAPFVHRVLQFSPVGMNARQ